MAIVTTSVTPAVKVTPFSGYRDVLENEGSGARASVFCGAPQQSIAATGVGDNQLITVDCRLPPNFSYALVDCGMALVVATGGTFNFALCGEVQLSDSDAGATRTQLIPMSSCARGVSFSLSNARETGVYFVDNIYSGIITPNLGTQVQLVTRLFNSTTNDLAYTFDFYARFLQFDILQADHIKVNSAQPVRG